MGMRVLVTGGSVAANNLAWWLVEGGFNVTVLERTTEFRDGGQNVDVRGVARDVLSRMNVEHQVADDGTGETGWTFVDENGKPVGKFEMEDLGSNGPSAELEILRGELARILYDKVKGNVEYRFGDSIALIENRPSDVGVRFEGGNQEDFDLLIIAEGVGSSTRELVFPDENEPSWMGLTMGYFTIPKGKDDSNEALWYNAPGGRSVFLRPDNKGTTRAVLTISEERKSVPERSIDEQKAWLKKTFADAGWETPRVLAGLEKADDLYFDVLRQVKMPHWSKGRVVLCGDSAWCATPLAGLGTSLSIVGGYVLAGELAKTDDHAAAFAEFERIMRPFVDKVQGGMGKKVGARLNHPHSRIGVAIHRTIIGVLSKPVIRKKFSKFIEPPADEITLPEYRFASSRAE